MMRELEMGTCMLVKGKLEEELLSVFHELENV